MASRANSSAAATRGRANNAKAPRTKAKNATAKHTAQTSSLKTGRPVPNNLKRLADHSDEDEREGSVPVPVAAKRARTNHHVPESLNARPSQKLDVFVFGDGSFGELGLGHKKYGGTKKPMYVKRPRLNHNLLARDVGVVQLACGGMHAIALTADNTILTWGVNDDKALGRDTTWDEDASQTGSEDADEDSDDEGLDPKESAPGQVVFSSTDGDHQFVQVAATDSASFVLTADGFVYGWGTFRSAEGILGFTQTSKVQPTPILISGLAEITCLAAGSNHMLALDKNGRIFTWGSGGQCQLGRKVLVRHGGPTATLKPMVCGRFNKRNHAVKIAAGSYQSFYIDNHGRAWGWGLNNYSQAGHPDASGRDGSMVPSPELIDSLRGDDIVQIDGGLHHMVACSRAGDVFVCGRIDGHQVGLPSNAFTSENTIFDEHNRPRVLIKPIKMPGLRACYVAAGIDTTIVIAPDGEAYSWGFSANNQAGQGTTDDIETPTLINCSAIAGKKMVWAGRGGQYSMLASTH